MFKVVDFTYPKGKHFKHDFLTMPDKVISGLFFGFLLLILEKKMTMERMAGQEFDTYQMVVTLSLNSQCDTGKLPSHLD